MPRQSGSSRPSTGLCERSLTRETFGTGLVPPRGTGCLLPGAPAPGWPPGGAAETPQKHPLGARGLPRSCGPAEVPGRPPRVLPTLRGVSRALLGRTSWTQGQSRPLLHLSPSSVPYRQSLILCPLAKVGLQGHGDGPERADLSWEAVTRHPASPFVRLLGCPLRTRPPCRARGQQTPAQAALLCEQFVHHAWSIVRHTVLRKSLSNRILTAYEVPGPKWPM